MESPDPKEQLVVEMWCSRKNTPKEVLQHALLEIAAAAAAAQQQLNVNNSFIEEEQTLRGIVFIIKYTPQNPKPLTLNPKHNKRKP